MLIVIVSVELHVTHKPTIGLTDIHQILNLVHFSLTCDICGNSINDPPDN